jgi:hypothetical protein
MAAYPELGSRSTVALRLQRPHEPVALEARATWASGIGTTGCHGVAFPGPQSPDLAGELFIREAG